jgi:hypothetical protein
VASIIILTIAGCRSSGPASVPTSSAVPPGLAVLNAFRLVFNPSIEIKAGDTGSVDVTLETHKDGPGKVIYTLFRVSSPNAPYNEGGIPSGYRLPMPQGMVVSIEPSGFDASPNNIYQSLVTVRTTPELISGEYVLFLDLNFENVAEGGGNITVNVSASPTSASPSPVDQIRTISREQAIETASKTLPPSIVSRAKIQAEIHGWYWEVIFDNLNATAAELMPWPLKGPPPPPPGQPTPEPYPGIWQTIIATVDTQTGDLHSIGARHAAEPGPYIGMEQAIQSARELMLQIPTDVSWVEKAKVEAYLRGDT